jgi:hypothetical protein
MIKRLSTSKEIVYFLIILYFLLLLSLARPASISTILTIPAEEATSMLLEESARVL